MRHFMVNVELARNMPIEKYKIPEHSIIPPAVAEQRMYRQKWRPAALHFVFAIHFRLSCSANLAGVFWAGMVRI